jgi:TetR/AcrR family transcriptional regulator, transcriptional repressor for nem operon
LSINLIVQNAGVTKGTFFHHFGDRASHLIALHREFHERLAARIQAAIVGVPPGSVPAR